MLRSDIQGLRGVAVLMVVAYHMGINISGGFFGVDIFFVISGYVITLTLIKEIDTTNKINLLNFYARRFFRLFPALSLMVTVVLITSFFIYEPFLAQSITSKTAIGSIFFSSNIVIAKITKGYFDAPAQMNPLLNV